MKIIGRDPKADNGSMIHHVRPNFFEALNIKLLAGRGLSAQDTAQAPVVAVLNQAAAKKFFGNENPLGKRIGMGRQATGTEMEIVGVVSDVKYGDLRKNAPPTTYFSIAQVTQFTAGQATYAVRTAGDTAALAAGIRNAVKQVDPNLPVTDMRTQTEQTAQTFAQEKLFAQLTSFFGLLTLGLVSIGLYGMMSYSVAQRRREMGIRLALGAPAGALLRMVLRQGLTLVLLGLGLGGLLAWGATRWLTSYLFGVSTTNPLVFVLTALLLLAVALIACFIPARRAAQTDPMIALRYE
jgi:predicted permease